MSEKLYGVLLRFYPRTFRDQYGESMRQLFRDRLRLETGLACRSLLWWDVLRDLAISIPREHLRRRRVGTEAPVGYRMSKEAIAAMVWRGHLKQAPFTIACIVFSAAVGWIGNAPLWGLVAVYGVLLSLAAFPLLRVRRFKNDWRRFALVVNEDSIHQFQRGSVTLTLRKDEVTRFVESDFGMAIQTQDPRRSIWVPSLLSGYRELRAQLSMWAPVELRRDFDRRQEIRFRHWFPAVWFLYPAALLVRSVYFAIPLALLLGGVLVLLARRTRNADREAPLALRLMTYLMLASLGCKAIFVLFWR